VLKFRKDPCSRGVDDSDSKKATFAKQMPSRMAIVMAPANELAVGEVQQKSILSIYRLLCRLPQEFN